MPTDYKSRATRHHKKSLPGYVWLLSGLAIGLFVAFIIYLDKQPENPKTFGNAVQQELEKIKKQTNNQNQERKTHKSESTSNVKKEQKYDFYAILKELEILIPENETRPPANKESNQNLSHNKQKKSNRLYILQAGSFQNLGDAEKLKASLAFLGLEADIQQVKINKQTWHRVRTGPYQNKQQLYQNQKLLKQNNISSISIELK